MTAENLKKAITEKTFVIGTERTLKELKNGKVKEVFLAKNCPELIKKKVQKYSEVIKVKIIQLTETNEEVGSLCKKPFSINICCY